MSATALQGEMRLRIWDVEHGACAMLHHQLGNHVGRLAMIDSGCTAEWHPSTFIKHALHRNRLDYLFITNADQDHMSDLQGLWDEGIEVPVVHHNPTIPNYAYEAMKKAQGPLTGDAKRYLAIHEGYTATISEPFNYYMGGITFKMYYNSFPQFFDTNNLSIVVFIRYANFQIAFPGDLEVEGWEELLKRQEFCDDLAKTTVLVASHHGRENGYCADVFNHCRPRVVVMSDKAIVHDTQGMTQTYRQRVCDNHPSGVLIATTGKQRRVLTTRKDGHIQFNVMANGDFIIETECG